MTGRLGAFLVRGRDILVSEGLKTLLVRGFDYFRRRVVTCREFYLYKHSLVERDGAAFLPRFEDFDLKIVSSNEEADRLAVEMGFDIRRRFVKARDGLNNGAVAFCVFVNGELAHIGWVAMNKAAKSMFDNLPYKVDFANGEACTGGTETMPEYRGHGLMAYGYYERLRYLRDRGYRVSRNAVEIDNIASHKVQAKFSPKIYARGRHIRLFCLKDWREWPPGPTDRPG